MKPIFKTLLILTVYEIIKYVTEQILISKLSIDDIDKYPKDYEVSEWLNIKFNSKFHICIKVLFL